MMSMALAVASSLSSCTQEQCSRMLAISHRYGLRPGLAAALAERLLVHVRRAGGDHHAVELLLGDRPSSRRSWPGSEHMYL